MWRTAIGPYRFGRIHDLDRWIKMKLDGPDIPETVWLSDLICAMENRSNGLD
jgi:hypothetical protein